MGVSGSHQTRPSIKTAFEASLNDQKVQAAFNMENTNTIDATATLNTPFRAFNQMVVATQHQHNMDSVSNKLDINFNREKVLDTDVAYSRASGKVEMKLPYEVAANVDTTGDLNDLNSNVQLKFGRDNDIKFQVSHKDGSSSSGIQKDVTVRLITAYRTMSVSTSLVKNAYTLAHNAAFSWDEAQDKTISYKVDFNDRSRRYKHLYSLVAGLYTPIRSAEMTMNHNDDSETYNTEATLKWDAKRDETKKLSMSNKYTVSGQSHEDELTISHPAMPKDLTLRNKFMINNGKVLFSGSSEIDFLSTPVMVDVTVEDKASAYGSKNYSVTIGCSHPSSTVDIQTVAHIADSTTMMTSGFSFQYLTARRQQVNMGLQAQINKIKKSMNMQIETPIKSAVISGDITPVSGGYAVNMAAESEGKSLNGRVETSDKEFDMKLFYSPGTVPSYTVLFRLLTY
jgi:hypothetical protein